MSSGFAPLAGPALAPARPARTRRPRDAARPSRSTRAQPLTWCVLLVTILLQAAVLWRPQALLLGPVQNTVAFKTVTGYTMLVLLVFCITFGWVRRHGAMARQGRRLGELHQLAGLALLVMMAFHGAGRPAGFLLVLLHAMAIGLAAGALRGILGPRLGRGTAAVLLTLHVGLSFLVCAAALVHVWFVVTYTA